MWLGCEWHHARKRWRGNLVISKNTLIEFWLWVQAVQLRATGCAFVGSVSWDLTLCRAVQRTEGRCRKSNHSKKCVSLSSCRKTKTQEMNKRFVPEQLEFRISLHLNILHIHILAMLHNIIILMRVNFIPKYIPIFQGATVNQEASFAHRLLQLVIETATRFIQSYMVAFAFQLPLIRMDSSVLPHPKI